MLAYYPPPFVLKSNNGCGDIKVVKEITADTNEELKKHFAPCFIKKYGLETAEPHYTRIKPCIVVEQFLDASLQVVPSTSLIDYKFWCFNGKPVCCFVCSDRSKQHFTVDLYSADDAWERIEDGNLVYDTHHLKATEPMPRPQNLKLMLELASALSKGHPQMRVDLYEVAGKVYFGEITMTSQGGRMQYLSERLLEKLGAECKNAFNSLNNR